jgi:hypothetical protein
VPFIIYSALRIALIVVVGVVLYLVGMRGWLLGVVAILVALLVSYLALSRQREAAALYIATRRTQRLDRDNADEDEAIDASAGRSARGATVPVDDQAPAVQAAPAPGEVPVTSDRETDPEK